MRDLVPLGFRHLLPTKRRVQETPARGEYLAVHETLVGIRMFLAWRTQLREAQKASELGRLDEAAQRLATHQLRQFKPGADFARDLARAYLARAMRRAEEGNFLGASHDLDQAQLLDGATESWLATRTRAAKQALAAIEALLVAGRYDEAQQQVAQLEKGLLDGDAARHSLDAIRRLAAAEALVQRGKYAEAEQQLIPAVSLRPEWNLLCDKLQTVREAHQHARAELRPVMSESPTTGSWSASSSGAAARFMLWIDGVGGYLVCLADDIWIGQATPGSQTISGNVVAIGIQGELARQHAKLTRSGEGYVLEAAHPVTMDGRPVSGKRVLSDGDEFELGRGVRIRFRQPHSLSATARLEILSRHRTAPHADGVLLMAESCVLGPKWQNHVVCKDWGNDVVLFRQGANLFCRTSGELQIDGTTFAGRGPLTQGSHASGEDFAFSIERLS